MGCRGHLCHLLGLGQVGHSPRGTSGSAGTLDWGPMWFGSLSSGHHLTNPKPDRLIFCHMAGCLANCSWQAGWLPIKQNVNLTLPQAETFCGHVCDGLAHIDQMYCYIFMFLANILCMSSVDFISLFSKLGLAFEECLINSFSIHNRNFLNF